MLKHSLVAILDQMEPAAFAALPGAERFRIVATTAADGGWLAHHLREAEVYWSSLRVPLGEEVLAGASRLRVVVTNSTGTDHLDLEVLRRRGISLISLKEDREFLNTVTPTAELAFALLLACARRLPECVEATRRGDWARHRLGGNQVGGKTLGIIGLGRLGAMMAGYGRAFGMKVLASDPDPEAVKEGVERVRLGELLERSDFVSIHVHLTEATRGLIGAAEFGQMKRGAVLINTSRGGLVDEAALVAAMEAGVVQAAGLDVIDGEWLEDKAQHPLVVYSRRNPRLIITPHTGGACPEAGMMTSAHSMRKLVEFISKST